MPILENQTTIYIELKLKLKLKLKCTIYIEMHDERTNKKL